MPQFKDIPQLTGFGYYAVDMPLSQIPSTIERYTKMGLDLNPPFQRGHVWNDAQRSAFMEFILRGGTSGKEINFNCVGWQRSKLGPFVIVDGLQRLTACLRFMDDTLPAFGHLYSEYTGSLAWDVGLRFRINDLKTEREVLQWYLEMNVGAIAHTQAELDKVRQMLLAVKD